MRTKTKFANRGHGVTYAVAGSFWPVERVIGLAGVPDNLSSWWSVIMNITPIISIIGLTLFSVFLWARYWDDFVAPLLSGWKAKFRRVFQPKTTANYDVALAQTREVLQADNWLHKREAMILLFESDMVKKFEETGTGDVNAFIGHCFARIEVEAPEMIKGRVNYNERLFRLWIDKES